MAKNDAFGNCYIKNGFKIFNLNADIPQYAYITTQICDSDQ